MQTEAETSVAASHGFDGSLPEVASQSSASDTWKRIDSNDGSVRLAAQEGRDIENLFLDRAAYGSGAAERIEALRCRRPRMFRDRPCRPHFGVAGRWQHRRRRRHAAFDPLRDAAPVVAEPAGEVRQ